MIKRHLWCRIAHRWHPAKLGGYTRTYCQTCHNWPKLAQPPESHQTP